MAHDHRTVTPAILLPCPFCGGKAEFVKRDVEPQGDPWYGKKVEEFVECQECSACLFDGVFHEGFYDKSKAVEAWNRRSPTDARALLDAAPGTQPVVPNSVEAKSEVGG